MSSDLADYERCLVAGCKRRPALIDELRVRQEDFQDKEAATVFRAIVAIRQSGREVDEVSLYQEAQGITLAYIATLPEAAAANAGWYLERIRDASLRRRIKAASSRIAETIVRVDMDAAEILDAMDKEVTALGDSERAEIVWLKDVLKAAVDDIQRRAANPNLACTGIESGYWDLDALTDGFQPGELIVIAARPSLGKTALAVSLLVNMSVRGKTVAGFFSCEMSEVLIGQRFLANVGRFNLGHVRRGVIAKTDASGLLAAASELYHEQVILNTTPNIKLADLKGLARSMVRRGARILVVDYLTLIQHGDPRTPRHERVGEVSKQLKGLARELAVPVIVLSQLARTAEGKEPNLAELRQCVAGETVIGNNAGRGMTIREICDQKLRVKVRTMDDGGDVRNREPSAVFLVGQRHCYRVRTKSGKVLIVSADTPLMRSGVWTKTADLRIGDKIATYHNPGALTKGRQVNTGRTHFKPGSGPWNKGLTKASDSRIANRSGFRKGVSMPKPEGFAETMRAVRPARSVKHDAKGYVKLYMPEYKWGGKNRAAKGFIYEHQYVMEQHIRRQLLRWEQIHHIDGDKQNNRIENLHLCSTITEHTGIHQAEQRFVERLIREGRVRFNGETKDFEILGNR